MASSLASQLAARTTLDSTRLASSAALKNPPSFIYTPRHAASVSTADLHATASNAWEQLSAIDPFFERFHNQILGEEAKGTDRSALTREENEKLSKVLEKVLRALGRHMLLKPAGIVLEWLVRRFRVNDLNAGELIALFLPYHTTPHLPSSLQLISEPVLANSIYVSLTPARRSLAPLPLDSLIALLPPFSSVASARPFLDFVLQLPLAYLRNDEKPHRALVGFWLQVVAGYLERAGSKLPAGEAASVLSTILEVLRLSRDQPDPLIASYILLARYSLHNPFAEETLRVILKTVVTNRAREEVADEETDAAFVTTLVVVAQLGVGEIEVKAGKRFLGGSGWKALTRINKLDDLLVQLCNQYDAERFMTPFLRTLAAEAAKDDIYLPLLTSLLTPRLSATDAPLLLPNRIVAVLTTSALSVLLAAESLNAGLVKVLNQVYQRWPTVWEAETKQRIVVAEEGAAEGQENLRMNHLWHVMNSVLSGSSTVAGSTTATGMFLSASSPDSTVRLIALKELLNTPDVYDSNPSFVHDTLIARLAEPDTPIVDALLNAPAAIAILHSALTADEIFTTVVRSLETPQLPVPAAAIVLKYIANDFLVAHPEQADQVLVEIFMGRLLVSKAGAEERVAGLQALAGSKLAQHAWIQGVSSHLLVDWQPKTTKIPPTAVLANATIVELVASNIAKLAAGELATATDYIVSLVNAEENTEQLSIHQASAQLFATLVAAQLSSHKLEVSDRVAFVSKIISNLKAETAGVAAFVTKEVEIFHDADFALSAPLAQAVFTTAQSSKTFRRVRAALLSTSIASIRPVEGSAWTWLNGKSTGELSAYTALVSAIYYIGNTAASGAAGAESLAQSILSALFVNILGDDLLAFLASIWTSSTSSAQLKCNALRDGSLFVKTLAEKSPRDFQMVLPSVLLALQQENKAVRVAALLFLVEMKAVLPSATAEVYGRDLFYGAGASNVQFLDVADIANYVKQMLDSRVEFSVDGQYLRTFHQSRLVSEAGSKKKASLSLKVATFVISHVTTWNDIVARTALLRILSGLTEPAKGALLIPVLAETVQATHKQRTELFEGVSNDTLLEYSRLLLQPYEGASRKWLDSTETKALAVFCDALEIKDVTGAGAILRKEAFVIVRTSIFASIRGENRLDLFKRLIRLAVVPESRHAPDIVACLRGCAVDSTTITAFLNDVRLTLAGPVSKGAKRGRVSLGNTSRSDRLSELVVALETVEFKSIAVTHGLILSLFELLSALMEISTSAQVDIQYCGQLMLATLSKVVDNVKPDTGITSDSIRMSPVLDFMRASTNPQTSHQALLLLAQLGPLVPDQLVHNVMPIFTFMGANVLQRDDAYSLRVVERTLESIVPALVQSVKRSATTRDALVTDLGELLRIFTDAATHVPRHRRTKLFVRFVETLGASEFLSAVAMLLLEKAGQTTEGSMLPIALVESFSVDIQLSAFKQVIEEISRLAKSSDGGLLHTKSPSEDGSSLDQVVTLVNFLSIALDSKQLVAKVDAARAGGNAEIDLSLSEIVRGLLHISAVSVDQATPAESAEFASATSEALQSAVRLMSTQSFSEAIIWLLDLADPLIRSSALVLLRSRLPTIKAVRRQDVSPAVIAVVDRIQGSFDLAETDVESSLATLDVVATSVFPAEDAALAKTVPTLIEVASRVSVSNVSRSLILSIIKKLSNRLGPRLIPLVSKIIPFAVQVLRQEAASVVVASRSIVTAAFEILEGLFTSIPTFIGGQLDNVFQACLSEEIMSLTAIKDSPAAKARAALLSTASKKLPAKTVYPAIIRLHAGLDGETKEPILGLLDVLNRALRQGKTTEIADNYRPIFKLFLTIFDLRRVHSAALSLDDIAEIEENALGAFVQFILKLNETTFKPLFLRTYDWAVIDLAEENEDGSKHTAALSARRTVLYKLVDRLLVQLKSIMVPFFSFMLDQTIDLLESFAGGHLRDSILWSSVTSALTKALDFDESGFWNVLRLSKISNAVATQLQSPHPLSTLLVTKNYQPLLASYAQALLPHELLLKEFNTSLLMLTRSDDLRVKRGALESLEVMWDTLGDGMLGLVPETTPFLAETVEETEGGVEMVTRRLIKTVEAHLGESLEDFLNT